MCLSTIIERVISKYYEILGSGDIQATIDTYHTYAVVRKYDSKTVACYGEFSFTEKGLTDIVEKIATLPLL